MGKAIKFQQVKLIKRKDKSNGRLERSF